MELQRILFLYNQALSFRVHKHLLIFKHPSSFAFNFYLQAHGKPRKGRLAVQDLSADSQFS